MGVGGIGDGGTLRSMRSDWPAAQSIKPAGSSEAQHREIEVFCLGQPVVCPCWLTISQSKAGLNVLLTLSGGYSLTLCITRGDFLNILLMYVLGK